MTSVRRPKLFMPYLICCKCSDKVVTIWFLTLQKMGCYYMYNYDCVLCCDSRSLKSCLQRRHQGLCLILSPDRGERDLSIDVSVCESRGKWRGWGQGRQGGKRAEHSLTVKPELCWPGFSSYVNMSKSFNCGCITMVVGAQVIPNFCSRCLLAGSVVQ